MIFQLPAPNLIGAPARYDKWRTMQGEAVLAAADSKKRFIVQGAPTGFGKSLTCVCTGLLSDARMVILTSTKALMSQYHGDFKESGMIEIRGLNSYECVEGRPTGKFGDLRREGYRADRGLPMMCDEAPCQAGAWCVKREGGCLYYDAYRAASAPSSKLIVTNYAYWMSINKFGEGMGQVDILVCDEAHESMDELGNFIGTELRPTEIESAFPGEGRVPGLGTDQNDWVSWGVYWHGRATVALELIKLEIRDCDRLNERVSHSTLKQAKDLKRLVHKLETIARMRGDWVIEWQEDNQRRPVIKFDPVWPGEYAESALFLGIPKVILVSATVRPKTAEMLGIDPSNMEFKEYPSSFAKANRPIIFLPTVHMNKTASADPDNMREMVTRIDQIVGRRLDRKALIQTVSYPRARDVYRSSDYKEMMLIHDSNNTKEVIDQFKRSKKPLILVSPVLDTGYDFPYEQAEYQIIMKMPFPVTVDEVVKARAMRDKGYKNYVTMVKLVQMAGRIVRAEDDRGETIILDSDFGWWFRKFGQFLAPKWFVEAVRYEQMLGMPLPKLIRAA